jgi:hypothetical protein
MMSTGSAKHATRPASGRPRRHLWVPLSRQPAAPLEIVAILCLVAWLLSVLSGYTARGAAHLLLAAAALAIALRVWQTRRRDRH